MQFTEFILAVLLGLALTGGLYGLTRLAPGALRFLTRRSALQLPVQPIPESWPVIVDRNVPLSHDLDAAQRERLIRLAQALLAEVPMEGCDGLEVTDEMRVTIAATACLLLLNQPYPRFLALKRVLIYPDTFIPATVASLHGRAIQTDPEPTLGQAWMDGVVILSWSSVLQSAEDSGQGRNVVLHEFAHILDGEDRTFDGAPILDGTTSVREWSRVLETEFARQQNDVDAGREPALDPYAATNPAEFFAVATETFFDAPQLLRDRLPELYSQLSRYYRQDPASRP